VRFYEDRVLPYLVDWSMRQPTFKEYRSRLLTAAQGCVLEIGVGSGLNLPFYGDAVRHVIGLEPSPTLLSMARNAGPAALQPIELLQASAEGIPLENDSVDTVVSTWTLCSIPDVIGALGEMQGNGFCIERIATRYMKGPRPMTYMYEGAARPI
jgi:ubiquinone/menaquinone biosynthesis C-methylase UbiE